MIRLIDSQKNQRLRKLSRKTDCQQDVIHTLGDQADCIKRFLCTVDDQPQLLGVMKIQMSRENPIISHCFICLYLLKKAVELLRLNGLRSNLRRGRQR